MADLTLYDPFLKMTFTGGECFLCGTPLMVEETIPVFPQNLMEQYELQNRELLLLDKSIKKFSHLTLPCCSVCKQKHIKPLDEEVGNALARGYEGVKQLDENRLFLWLGRMYYGILFNELVAEKRMKEEPEHGIGYEGKMMLKMRSFFQLLQGIRMPIKYADFKPYSLFILEVDPTEDDLPFEYRDDINTQCFYLKAGNVAIIASLLDNNIIAESYHKPYEMLQGKALHPVQVVEFMARVFYKTYLLNDIPEYFPREVKEGDEQLVIDTLLEDTMDDTFNAWEKLTYSQVLAEVWKRWDVEQYMVLKDFDNPLSFLFSKEGQPIEIKEFSLSNFI